MLRRTLRRSPLPSPRRALSSPAAASFKVDNPYTGETHAEVRRLTYEEGARVVARAADVFEAWRRVPLEERRAVFLRAMDAMEAAGDAIAADVSGMMGKPVHHARGELATMLDRGRAMAAQVEDAMRPIEVPRDASDPRPLTRRVLREPVGPVMVLAPWNYPLLCTMNPLGAAVLTGSPALVKHSERSPLVADHFVRAFAEAGAPDGLVQALQVSHADVARLVQHPAVGFVSFTGSVAGGRAVYRAVAEATFVDAALELGGKDPAYVAEDADLARAADGTVDGAFFNAGQSCCAVERVYVHRSLHDRYVEAAAEAVSALRLGDPADPATAVGPMAQPGAPAFLAAQVEQAVAAGARLVAGTGRACADASGRGRFFSPTLLAGCDHGMGVMVEESFGPVLAVCAVDSDEEAVRLMNDSAYGLTASVWTASEERALRLAGELDAGTVFRNRCDFVDPYLAWSGRKDSGKGVSLSPYGFHAVTRTKSLNFLD